MPLVFSLSWTGDWSGRVAARAQTFVQEVRSPLHELLMVVNTYKWQWHFTKEHLLHTTSFRRVET